MDPNPALTLHAQPATNQRKSSKKSPDSPLMLTRSECFSAILVFVLWVVLFGGGVAVDTRPYRCLISPGGVQALEDPVKYDRIKCDQFSKVTRTMRVTASGIILLWFLPSNLALICASAGVLGTFGNRAGLGDNASPRPLPDTTNPYISAMLRGFFVYLILISGLLVLDVNPFSNPDPGQYIRLAGFLSLFGFVLSYRPHLFRRTVVWISQRIEQSEASGEVPKRSEIVLQQKDTHEVNLIHAEPAEANALPQPPSPGGGKTP